MESYPSSEVLQRSAALQAGPKKRHMGCTDEELRDVETTFLRAESQAGSKERMDASDGESNKAKMMMQVNRKLSTKKNDDMKAPSGKMSSKFGFGKIVAEYLPHISSSGSKLDNRGDSVTRNLNNSYILERSMNKTPKPTQSVHQCYILQKLDESCYSKRPVLETHQEELVEKVENSVSSEGS